MKALKAGGVEGLGNDEKAALIDTRPRHITATELFDALGIPSSSYYYLRSRPERADAYAEARAAIREEFELVCGSGGTATSARGCASGRTPSVCPARR